MPRSAKIWFRRVAALLGVAVLAAALYTGWYVYRYGFTHKWRTLLTAELRRRGLDFSATSLTLSPFEGLVAEDANLYLLDEHHTHLMAIKRAAVDINFLKLIQKKSFLNSLDLRGTRLLVPVDMGENPPKLRFSRLQAKLIFRPDEVQIAQAEGQLQGIQISISGSLLHPGSFTPGTGPPLTLAERDRRREIARTILAEIHKIRSDGPLPRIEARFSGDLAQLSGLRAEVQVRGDGIRRGGYRLETLRAQADYERGNLRLQTLQMADARGRLSASGEFNPASREARFQLDSSLDLPALVREFLPAGESLLTPFVLHETPHLRIDEGRVWMRQPEGQDHPVTPVASIDPAVPKEAGNEDGKPPSAGFQLTGRLSLGRCAYRGLEFERAETEFTCKPDRWYLRGLRLTRLGNSGQQVGADVLSEPGTFRVRLNSTFDPTALAPLLPARGRAMLNEWKFQDAPRLDLTATGHSADDPDSFHAEGHLNLGRTRYRGVGLNRLQTEFTYGDHALAYRHFTVERDEGTGTGDSFVYDFGRHEARVENVRATLDPGQVAVWIDPDVAHAVAPYHFRKPPATVTNGVVQFDGGRNSRLTVDFNAPGGMEYTFVRRPLVFQSVSGQVLFTDDRLRLNDLRGEILEGQLRGSLDLSLVKGAADYSAAMEAQDLDFARLTKLFFDYDTSKGKLSGFYHFTGHSDDSKTLHGVGQLHVDGGNVFAIPFLGPLSGVLGQALPNFGMDVAHEATADFRTDSGKIYTSNINVKGAGFSLLGAGWLGYTNDTMNLRVRVNTRGLPGAVLYPVSKLLEYSSQGPLAKPVWKPRIFNAIEGPGTGASGAPAAPPVSSPIKLPAILPFLNPNKGKDSSSGHP